jgi:hypothetical protein
MKKAVVEWLKDMNEDKLPDPKILENEVMLRDFSKYEIANTDTEEQKRAKKEGMKTLLNLMDFYVEKMVACVAGPNLYHHRIRHFEPMTTAVLHNIGGSEQLRVPPSTEAMAVLAYMNNHSKWNAMVA